MTKRLSIAPRPARPQPVIPTAGPVRNVKPYQAVSSLDDIRRRPEQVPHKLDWNEATVPPSPRVEKAIVKFLTDPHHLNWYPVLNSTNLIERLSEFHGLPADQFLVSNGSDDALDTVCKTFLNEGDTVLVASPTYQHFLVFAQSRGAEIIHHYNPDPFVADVEGLREVLIRRTPRVLYLVSPNNPTGTVYTKAEVVALLTASPQTLVIVDEAYSEFAGGSVRDLLHTYSNLIVTRTFSKAYGLAGLRIGYAMASRQVVEDLRRVFNPKSVNVLAQIGAMAALDDQDYLQWFLNEVEASKHVMAEWCGKRGLDFYTTPANFVMIRFDRAPWVVRSLREVGVYVRDRSHFPQLAGCVRFSIGTVEQTYDVLTRLGSVLDRLD